MSERMRVARAYEQALLAGRMGKVSDYFTDDIVYWVAGTPPLGGEWWGREAVLRAMSTREFGLGQADWGSEALARDCSSSATAPTFRSSHDYLLPVAAACAW